MAAFVSLFWQHTELRLLLTNFWSWTLPRSADSYLRHIDLNRIFEGLSCLIWSVRRTDQMTDCTWRFGKHRESAKPGSQLFRTLWEDLGTTLAGFCSNRAEKYQPGNLILIQISILTQNFRERSVMSRIIEMILTRNSLYHGLSMSCTLVGTSSSKLVLNISLHQFPMFECFR